jgi:hypothetical protein
MVSLAHNVNKQVTLSRNVVIEAALEHTHPFGNIAQRSAVVSFFSEEFRRNFQQFRPALGAVPAPAPGWRIDGLE